MTTLRREERYAAPWRHDKNDLLVHIEDELITTAQTRQQAIRDAVWNGEIDQMSTREVAEQFGCPVRVARRDLMRIITCQSGDERFKPGKERLTVIISDGSTFTYSPVDMDGNAMSLDRPKHYIWFCY